MEGFVGLVSTPLGVRAAGVVVTDPVFVQDVYKTAPAQATAERRLIAELSAARGVRSAAVSLEYPESGTRMFDFAQIYGETYVGKPLSASINGVSPAYFATLGIPVVTGRAFRDSDDASSEPVAIVSQNFVNTYLRGKNPLGARLHVGAGMPHVTPWARIVGVVGNERVSSLVPDRPLYYLPLLQVNEHLAGLWVAEVYAPMLSPAVAGRETSRIFEAALPRIPPPDTFTFAQRVAADALPAKTMSSLVSMLAGIALALASSGVFGIVAFSVSRRIGEFGVRMALGATNTSIVFDVVRRSLGTAAIGCAIGVGFSIGVATLLRGNLHTASIFDEFPAASNGLFVSGFDPVTAAGDCAIVCGTAVVAAMFPAVKAPRIQPADCLRYE